jgi:hypothetical protein
MFYLFRLKARKKKWKVLKVDPHNLLAREGMETTLIIKQQRLSEIHKKNSFVRQSEELQKRPNKH